MPDNLPAASVSTPGDGAAADPTADATVAPNPGLTPDARTEFVQLLQEFARCWPDGAGVTLTPSSWPALRAIARRNFDALCEMDRNGLDVSDAALLKLLPYDDSPVHAASECWCHVLPGITGDLRANCEGAGWAHPEDWPALGRGLFDFVRRCEEHPAEVWQASGAFSALPGSRGFDSGLLSPILNALRPDDFLVINAAARAALNHFTGSSFGPELSDYPQANIAARRLIENLRGVLGSGKLLALRSQDSFALFCHWLMNVRLLDNAAPAADQTAVPAAAPAADPAPAPALAEVSTSGSASGTSGTSGASGATANFEVAETAAPSAAPDPATAPHAPALTDPFALNEPFASAEHGAAHGVSSAASPWEEDWLARLMPIVERKGQLVLCGPPGTGKTHLAERLAERLLAGGDGLCERIAFHASWSYADFIQSLQPHSGRRPGRFTSFCRQAAARRGRCVLLIDDLHRANVADVFGEALALLDRRGAEISLPGGGTLSVPPNVRVLATLDTSAPNHPLSDLALARRFAAVTLPPGEDLLRGFHRHTGFPVDGLIEVLGAINTQIRSPQRAMGVAFFLREQLMAELPAIWQSEVEPCLEQAFRDEPAQLEPFRWRRVALRILG